MCNTCDSVKWIIKLAKNIRWCKIINNSLEKWKWRENIESGFASCPSQLWAQTGSQADWDTPSPLSSALQSAKSGHMSSGGRGLCSCVAVVSITGAGSCLSPLQTCLQTSHARGLGPARDSAECLCFEMSKLRSRNESPCPCLSLRQSSSPVSAKSECRSVPSISCLTAESPKPKSHSEKSAEANRDLGQNALWSQTQVSEEIDLFLKLASFQMRSQSVKHLRLQSKKRRPGWPCVLTERWSALLKSQLTVPRVKGIWRDLPHIITSKKRRLSKVSNTFSISTRVWQPPDYLVILWLMSSNIYWVWEHARHEEREDE